MCNVVEQWKMVRDYPDYFVSSFGRVFSLRKLDFSKQSMAGKGYYIVSVRNHKHKRNLYVHRMVALAFIENQENKPEVDHIDSCKSNNRVENLRFATRGENNRNTNISSRSSTKVKGVYFQKARDNYVASIQVDGIRIHIGSFKTLEEAKEARIKKANEVFGVYTNACERM